MAEYFYTVELIPEFGERLERLAQEEGYRDNEQFAAVLLMAGIEAFEQQRERNKTREARGLKRYDLDDGIPF